MPSIAMASNSYFLIRGRQAPARYPSLSPTCHCQKRLLSFAAPASLSALYTESSHPRERDLCLPILRAYWKVFQCLESAKINQLELIRSTRCVRPDLSLFRHDNEHKMHGFV